MSFTTKTPALFIVFALALHGLSGLSPSLNSAFAAPAKQNAKQKLTEAEREELRARLEASFNEADLLIRNQRADEADLKRIEKEMEHLKVFHRIPFSEQADQLKKDLTESAKAKGLKILSFRVTGRSKPLSKKQKVPDAIFTDQVGFKLEPQQVASLVHFRVLVSGDHEEVKNWIVSWPDEQLRLVEPTGGHGNFPIKAHAKFNQWVVTGNAFVFRKIQFPRLKMRDPVSLLPAWARKNQAQFAKLEPRLWKYVKDTQELIPKARPLLESRRKFLLNQARMSFFVSKAVPRPVRTTDESPELLKSGE